MHGVQANPFSLDNLIPSFTACRLIGEIHLDIAECNRALKERRVLGGLNFGTLIPYVRLRLRTPNFDRSKITKNYGSNLSSEKLAKKFSYSRRGDERDASADAA